MERYKIKSTAVGIIALLLAVVTMQSHAESNGYVGFRISQAIVDESGIDGDDTGAKFFGGYKFNDYFAIEGGYYDFGDIIDSGSLTNPSSRLEIEGVSLAAVGFIPASDNVSWFGKIGIHYWDADTVGSISTPLSTNSDTDTFYGVGLDYVINDRWSLRGEIERYEVEDLDLNVGSVGVSFKF